MKLAGSHPEKARSGSTSADQKLLEALTALADSMELAELGRLLRQFNIFRVLRFEHGEIRHSNMLAWLFQPQEAHGLKERFLRHWLQRVLAECESRQRSGFSPEEVASWSIRRVEVEREWNHVDLLLTITTEKHGRRVVAIENKLRARQSEGQLHKYHKQVQAAFPRIPAAFVFLTEQDEEPASPEYITASHRQVHDVLAECLRETEQELAPGPTMLMKHYLAVLEDRNMGNQKITELAESIYQQHRLALDRIFEQRTNPTQRLMEAVVAELKAQAAALAIAPMAYGQGIVRFLPKAWNTAANSAGTAWGTTGSAHVLCEITVAPRHPRLEVVVAGAPQAWKTDLSKLCEQKGFPNATKQKGPDAEWMRAYSVKCPTRLNHEVMNDFEAKGAEVWRWCVEHMSSAEFKNMVTAVATQLQRLPSPTAATKG